MKYQIDDTEVELSYEQICELLTLAYGNFATIVNHCGYDYNEMHSSKLAAEWIQVFEKMDTT